MECFDDGMQLIFDNFIKYWKMTKQYNDHLPLETIRL